MTLQELVDLGILHEVNRRFFHPLGLVLAINNYYLFSEKDGDQNQRVAELEVLDYRDDHPEGMIFDRTKFPRIPR